MVKTKLYKVSAWSDDIKEIEADRVTDNSYWIGKRRNSFTTNSDAVFPSRQDAIDWKIKSCNTKIEATKALLAYEEKKLAEFKAKHSLK